MARSRSKKCTAMSRKMCNYRRACSWNRNRSSTRKHKPYCSKKRTGRKSSMKGGKVARRSRSRSRTSSKKGRKSRRRSRSRKGRKSRRRSRSRKARKVTTHYASNVAARRRARALKAM